MNRARTLAGWAAVALLAWPWGQTSSGGRRPSEATTAGTTTGGATTSGTALTGPATTGALTRWLGPVAALAASVEWVRWTSALGRGELARAHTHATRALALDPGSPEGWLALAQHLVFDRSSAEVEPDRRRRATFARAGLAVLRQGEARSRDAGALALIGGDLAVFLAERAQPVAERPESGTVEASGERDPAAGGHDLDWPGGPDALLDEARARYTRARDHGHPAAAERLARLDALR